MFPRDYLFTNYLFTVIKQENYTIVVYKSPSIRESKNKLIKIYCLCPRVSGLNIQSELMSAWKVKSGRKKCEFCNRKATKKEVNKFNTIFELISR